MFVGVVDQPQLITPITGMAIVGHVNTWAYTCGKRHSLQLGGTPVTENRIEKFGVLDQVAVNVDLNKHVISFYKNQVRNASDFKFQPSDNQLFTGAARRPV